MPLILPQKTRFRCQHVLPQRAGHDFFRSATTFERAKLSYVSYLNDFHHLSARESLD